MEKKLITKAIASAMVMALLAAVLALTALALFTDTQSVPSNTFTTGSVDISTSPTSALVTFSGMAPGDQVTNPITVTNAGTLQLRYAVTSTTTENTLAGQLDLTIKSGVTTCTSAGFGVDGTVVYAAGDLGNTSAINLIGNPAQGSQAGDRTLNASANEVLCFNVSLPSSTGNTYQGLTSTATFAFQAEQTSSNP
jgi:predicted ribosomally synthesized peptide with SipW-like signal peptide